MAEIKSKSDFTNPYTDVEVSPISVAGENVPTRVAVRVKDDAGQFQVNGIVGVNYGLIPNRRVRDYAEDIMSRADSKLGGFKNLKTLFDGKRYVDYFASNSPIANMNGGGSASELHLGLMVWNAYDGTRSVGFEVFALNPFCTNQYHSRNRFGYFAWRHQSDEEGGGIDESDALSGISAGVSNIIRIAPKIGALKKEPLTLPYITEVKSKVKIPQTRWGDVLDALKDEDPTRFGFYQALTNVASHKLTGLSAIDTGSSITEFFIPAIDGDEKGNE